MKVGATWTYFDRASGRSFVNSRNFITAAKWSTFEMEKWFSCEHIGIFTKKRVGGRDNAPGQPVQTGSYERTLRITVREFPKRTAVSRRADGTAAAASIDRSTMNSCDNKPGWHWRLIGVMERREKNSGRFQREPFVRANEEGLTLETSAITLFSRRSMTLINL